MGSLEERWWWWEVVQQGHPQTGTRDCAEPDLWWEGVVVLHLLQAERTERCWEVV